MTHGIPIKSGVNNCDSNIKGRCINKTVTRSNTTMNKDWDSKQNCTLTIYGVHLCSEYKPEK